MARLLILLALLGLDVMADPLADAQARFGALQTYQVTVRSAGSEGVRQVIRYFYSKPGWVRMEFIQPHRGAVLIYAPDTHRVRLWPFGLAHWPMLSLAPDHPLLRDPRGRRVDRSDVGVLLARLLALRERGSVSALGDADIAGRPATGFDIVGSSEGTAAGGIHHYRVWLGRDTLFPLRVESFEVSGNPSESVDMADAEVDVRFPDRFFTP